MEGPMYVVLLSTLVLLDTTAEGNKAEPDTDTDSQEQPERNHTILSTEH